jgi:hypothetical protein
MSGGTRSAGDDFPHDLTSLIVFVASRCDRFWCETGAVIATGFCGKRLEMNFAGWFGDAPWRRTGWPSRTILGPLAERNRGPKLSDSSLFSAG